VSLGDGFDFPGGVLGRRYERTLLVTAWPITPTGSRTRCLRRLSER
jgi:hypothetical protein